MGIDVVAFCLGGVLLLVGILGGGFELREIKVPSVGKALRVITFGIGLFFICLGVGLSFAEKMMRTTPEAVSKPLAPPAHDAPADAPPTRERVSVAASTEDHKPGLISAIRLADYAEIEAGQSLDPAPLSSYYSGEALRMQLANIDALRARRMTAAAKLEDQDFQSFKVSPDGAEAEVRVIETWETRFYNALDNECVGMVPSHKSPQTIHLKRGTKGWVITAIIHDLQSPDLVPCE